MAAASSSASSSKASTSKSASLIAGAFAGAVEGFATYPAEYVKTASQFSGSGAKGPGPIAILKDTIRTKGVIGLYSGCGALVAGNAVKAGVRFFSYDKFKTYLVNKDGKLTGPRSLVAGLGAGMMEAIFAVTPSETIKTKLIDDQKRAVPKYNGLAHGTAMIIREEGIGGIYRGLFPVMMRQSANSAVRFTSYSSLKTLVQGNTRPGEVLPTGITFAIGGVAGIITVYATMPFDVVKTRMQSLEARQNYRHSFHCAARILSEEGVLRFWAGATPRLVRLVLSGGIVFTVYEYASDLVYEIALLTSSQESDYLAGRTGRVARITKSRETLNAGSSGPRRAYDTCLP